MGPTLLDKRVARTTMAAPSAAATGGSAVLKLADEQQGSLKIVAEHVDSFFPNLAP